MRKLLLFWSLILSSFGVLAQECPASVLVSPLNGATDVPVNTTISWNEVNGVPGYIISIGTTSGGTDIADNVNVGAATSYTPPLGLPDDTQIYVTITLFFFPRNSPDRVWYRVIYYRGCRNPSGLHNTA